LGVGDEVGVAVSKHSQGTGAVGEDVGWCVGSLVGASVGGKVALMGVLVGCGVAD